MSSQEADNEYSVCFLHVTGTTAPGREHKQYIKPNDQFDVGRKQVQSWLGVEDPTLSLHHLRFWCIVYGEEDNAQVAPMVYLRVLSSNAIMYKDQMRAYSRPISKSDGDVLLTQGDVMELGQVVTLLFRLDPRLPFATSLCDTIGLAEIPCLSSRYVIQDRILGIGTYACVTLAVERCTGRQLACKILKPRPRDSRDPMHALQEIRRVACGRNQLSREHNILKNLSHPNIISVEKVFCTTDNIYMIQELVTGGDLFSYLGKRGLLTESEAVLVVFQLLMAINYLHDHQVVHRDIKPENVLVTAGPAGSRVVLTDFGHSRLLEGVTNTAHGPRATRMQSIVGTPGYMAPEIVRVRRPGPDSDSGYGKAVDIWCLGCIAACVLAIDSLVCGERAWGNESRQQHERKLAVLDESYALQDISCDAKAFIKSCLAFDEVERINSKQALEHRWFTNRSYATELRGAYMRAIAGWVSAPCNDNLVEYIDFSNIQTTSPMRVSSDRVETSAAPSNLPLWTSHRRLEAPVHRRLNILSSKCDLETATQPPNDATPLAELILHASPVTAKDTLGHPIGSVTDALSQQYLPSPSSQARYSHKPKDQCGISGKQSRILALQMDLSASERGSTSVAAVTKTMLET